MAQKTILIAEDDDTLRGILVDKLQQSGYIVTPAENGEVALDILRSTPPDLLLLDIIMPKKNGMEVLEAMHADPKLSQIPVIVVSNSGQPVEIERARALGARDFLIKAVFDPHEVLQKVNETLGGSSIDTSTATPKEKVYTKDEQKTKDTMPTAANAPVLLVEDDKFLRELLLEKLLSSNIRVLGAIDGKEAFKILETESPALILLDIILPDINGFEILAKIRQNPRTKNTPVLILSNLDQKEDLDRAHALGVSGFMIKANFSLGEIVTKINSILANDSSHT